MAGLRINICFWYLDPMIISQILDTLKESGFDPEYIHLKEIQSLPGVLLNNPPDLIISDYDLPGNLRDNLEQVIHESEREFPLIYMVGEQNESKAAEILENGIWDYIRKDHLLRLAPSVYASQKYEKVLKITNRFREHFKSLAENSPDLIIRFDREFRHRYINRIAEVMSGVKIKDYLHKTPREVGIFPEDRVVIWEKAVQRVFNTGKPHNIHYDIDLGRGKQYFEWRLYPEFAGPEQVESVVVVGRDITANMVFNQALRESEERLNLAVTATSLGLWDWNLVTNEVYFSPIWFGMLGYGSEEFPQKFETWTDLLHPEDRESSMNLVKNSIDNRDRVFEIEFRMLKKDKTYAWILAKGKAVEWDEKGNTTRLTGTHENITERKRSEIAQKVIYNISNAVMTTATLDELYMRIRESLGMVIDTTNCFLALYNQEHDTLTLPFMRDEKDSFTEFPARKTLTSYVINTGKTQLIDREREALLTEQGLIEPVGTPCVSWLGVPLRLQDKIIGVFVVQSYNEDMVFSEPDAKLLEFASDQIALAINRKQFQDNIRISQESQRRIFEASPDPMIVVDTGAGITDFNTSFLQVFNMSKEEAYGLNVLDFLLPEEREKGIRNFNLTWEKGYLKNIEYRIKRTDGLIFDGEVSYSAIYDSNGKPESMVLIVKNISERKEAVNRLREAKEKAEESDRLKTAFLSNMSHEIRTPMNAIVGFSDLLSDPSIQPGERRDYISQINQSADNLMRLIDDIIDIAKIEAGQIIINETECSVNDMFKDLFLIFSQQIQRMEKDEVELKIDWGWPSDNLVLLTDEFRLKQVLTNLIGNALKFTEKGFVGYGVKKVSRGIRFAVRDTGIGIRKEKQKIIFDRFSQGHDSKTKLYGGTGLGLAISKNIVHLLGGDIKVKSVTGKGSEFSFVLPLKTVIKGRKEPEKKKDGKYNWSGRKVLIAEDDHSNFFFIKELLRKTGIDILWSKDGEETMQVFREHEDIDLVLMDVRMPLIDGYECTRMIKEERASLPVIAQTAYAMAGEDLLSREAGCDEYICKPIKVKELFETMSKYIR